MSTRSITRKLGLTICCLYLVYRILIIYGAIYLPRTRHEETSRRPKLIVFGTSFWRDRTWEVGEGSEVFKNCPISNCYLTSDQSEIKNCDAVIYHAHEINEFPQFERSSDQRWIFFMLESPQYSTNTVYMHEPWKSAFNWTMTYRLDSDIPIPYGLIKRVSKKSERDYLDIAKSKSGLVAWFVSNCLTNSRRERYVEELSRYIPVDVIGRCGKGTCPRNYDDGDEECQTLINNTYLFYLSFESSLCKDYVTEKFYKVLQLDVVPVVRGGTADEYRQIAKHNWYINTNDFESPKALAEHLLRLSRNLSQYVTYFKGKELYDFGAYFGLRKLPQWCKLCEKLHDPDDGTKIIDDITSWWSTKDCVEPRDLR